MTIKITVQFADRPNAGGYLAVSGDMPTLRGSEKQIAWADDIRARFAKEFAEVAAKAAGVKFGAVLRADVDFIAETERKIAEALATMTGADRFVAAMSKVFAHDEARWWIDNQREPIAGFVRNIDKI